METPANRVDDSAMIYHINIRTGFNPQTKGVSFGSDGATITTQFATTDNIYIYNETKKAFARTLTNNITAPLISLHPSNISGAYCELIGDLTFYIWDDSLGEFGEWTPITVEDGDSYSLFYQMNLPSEGSSMFPLFDYSDQNGSVASASTHDFAAASGVVFNQSASSLTIPDGVVLNNLQSMFRLRLSFTNGGNVATPGTILALSASTKNETLVYKYRPTDTDGQYSRNSFTLASPVFTDNNDVYLSLAFLYDNSHSATGDELILTATDNNNDVYQGSVAVPSEGFASSKYYYGAVTLSKQIPAFTVTRNDGGNDNQLIPDDGLYDIYSGPDDYIDLTLTGSTSGNRFYLNDDPATVTLTGNDDPVSASWSGQNAFIQSDEDLTIILDCNYVIDNSAAYSMAIECGGELKLKTTGSTQTLTVITNDDGSFAYGIYGDSNWDCWMIPITDINNLAATGFTVTLSNDSPIDNNDGTYTWIYTVTPNP
jgi:hypothetical protein